MWNIYTNVEFSSVSPQAFRDITHSPLYLPVLPPAHWLKCYLQLLRKLGAFNVSNFNPSLQYRAQIYTHLHYFSIGSISITATHKTKLCSTAYQATRIIGSSQTPLSELYTRLIREGTLIKQDSSHPLQQSFHILPWGRYWKSPTGREKQTRNWKKKKCFLLSAIITLNK